MTSTRWLAKVATSLVPGLTALVALACSDRVGTGAPDAAVDTTPPARVLCDGSADVRLVYVNRGGGPLPGEFAFFGAYGHEFFVINGACQYWAARNYLEGIRTGTLEPAAAADIARELHYADFATLAASSGQGCPDASVLALSDGTRRVDCSCTCTQEGPAANRDVFTNLSAVQTRLLQGAPAALPIRLIAVASNDKEGTAEGTAPAALPWPLPWSPADVLVGSSPQLASAGRLVTDASELTALRGLRVMAVQKQIYFGVRVRTGDDKTFIVYPRDEAPPVVSQALDGVRF